MNIITYDEHIQAAAGEIMKAVAAKGITQSACAQEARIPGWSDHALHLLRRYCAVRKRRRFPGEFDIELFRDYAAVRGLPEPHNASAFGNVFMRASKEGLIVFAGYRVASNPSARGRPIRKWVAA